MHYIHVSVSDDIDSAHYKRVICKHKKKKFLLILIVSQGQTYIRILQRRLLYSLTIKNIKYESEEGRS